MYGRYTHRMMCHVSCPSSHHAPYRNGRNSLVVSAREDDTPCSHLQFSSCGFCVPVRLFCAPLRFMLSRGLRSVFGINLDDTPSALYTIPGDGCVCACHTMPCAALLARTRYGHMKFNKQSRRKMFTIWAKKEHRNLLRLHRRGVPCPEPIMQREHTLVMSFVGKDHWPAPQLRELDLSPSNWRRYVLISDSVVSVGGGNCGGGGGGVAMCFALFFNDRQLFCVKIHGVPLLSCYARSRARPV